MATYIRTLTAALLTSGLVATLGYTVVGSDGSTLIARTTAGIAEEGASANYYANVAGWDTAWTGRVIWDAGAGVLAQEDFIAAPTTAAEIAAAVWASASRTLTQSAAQVAEAVAGSTITIQRGDTLSASLTDVGNLAGRTKLWFTVKRRRNDADSAALIQIEETAGLLYLNGAAPGSGQTGSITVTDAPDGDLTIALSAAAAAALPAANELVYDIQILTASGVVTRAAGIAHVAGDVTRAVS